MTTKVYYEIQSDAVRFAQWSGGPDERVAWLGQDHFKRISRHEQLPDEAIHTLVAPQEMMDELWRLGYRPAENVGTAGHLQALEKHIKFAESVTMALLPAAMTGVRLAHERSDQLKKD